MGIFTLLAIFVPLITMAAIWEGFLYLRDLIRDRRKWKYQKAFYYPNGVANEKAIRRLYASEAIQVDGWVYYPEESELA